MNATRGRCSRVSNTCRCSGVPASLSFQLHPSLGSFVPYKTLSTRPDHVDEVAFIEYYCPDRLTHLHFEFNTYAVLAVAQVAAYTPPGLSERSKPHWFQISRIWLPGRAIIGLISLQRDGKKWLSAIKTKSEEMFKESLSRRGRLRRTRLQTRFQRVGFPERVNHEITITEY